MSAGVGVGVGVGVAAMAMAVAAFGLTIARKGLGPVPDPVPGPDSDPGPDTDTGPGRFEDWRSWQTPTQEMDKRKKEDITFSFMLAFRAACKTLENAEGFIREYLPLIKDRADYFAILIQNYDYQKKEFAKEFGGETALHILMDTDNYNQSNTVKEKEIRQLLYETWIFPIIQKDTAIKDKLVLDVLRTQNQNRGGETILMVAARTRVLTKENLELACLLQDLLSTRKFMVNQYNITNAFADGTSLEAKADARLAAAAGSGSADNERVFCEKVRAPALA